MTLTATHRQRFLQIAESLKPVLFQQAVKPCRLVTPVEDPSAFQHWRMECVAGAIATDAQPLTANQPVIYDFGRHLVARIVLKLSLKGVQDAPVRLKITLAETPYEAASNLDSYAGSLSRAWLQDDMITIDVIDGDVALPRRYAFQYLKIELLSTSGAFTPAIESVTAMAETSADEKKVPALPAGIDADLRRVDEVSLRTLHNGMQTVFEDGPKRDRRLWLGDLRLQAMTNSVSFQNYDLVKRCLYLFAGLTRDDGIVNSDIYEYPAPTRGGCTILDYSALFADTVLAYARNSDDWQTARDLWPVVVDQLKLLQYVDKQGLFADPGNWWLFIDWQNGLDKQACEQAILIIMIQSTLELAKKLGCEKSPEIAHLPAQLALMKNAAIEQLYDSQADMFCSGVNKQISWASQAWMTLAQVLAPAQHAKSLMRAMKDSSAIQPAGPYLHHVVTHALFAVNLKQEALDHMRHYWGSMIALGASTFWEVFDPADQNFSPYHDCRINSYCHAWSCTPSWFIRTYIADAR